MKSKFKVRNKVVFNDNDAEQFNIPKGKVFTVKSITHRPDEQNLIFLEEQPPSAGYFESRFEYAYKYNHKLMPKLNLKAELQQLVKDHEIKSGLIDALAKEAFDSIAKACRTAAERGKRSVDNVPVSYVGCKGGYAEHSVAVIGKLNKLLHDEELSFSMDNPSAHTGVCKIKVSW